MSDLKRLIEEGSPFERMLLESSEGEGPSPALEEKILAAIPAAAASAKTSETRLVAAKPASSLVRPAAVVVGAIGLLLVGALVVRSSSEPASSPVLAPSPVVVPSTIATPAPIATSAEVPTVSLDSLPSAPLAERALAPKVVTTPSAPTAQSPATDETSGLEREIKLLDTVKSKLGDGAHADALRTLDTYDVEFPQGTLRPEATVLRIRTLLLEGRRADAQRLADDFLAKHPTSVHAKRIRALLAGTAVGN
jgi:hypothetical protein